MPESLERELKFALPAETPGKAIDFAPAGSVPAEVRQSRLVATYFDTADQALLDAGYVLRVRRDGEQLMQTVKSVAGSGSIDARMELEVPATSHLADIDLFGPAMAAEFERALNGAVLLPAFEVAVDRTTRMIAWSGATFEIALDRGTVAAGGKAAPILEVEIEQKTGAPEHLHVLVLQFADATDAHLLRATKSDRGFALLGRFPRPFEPETPPVGPGATAGEALALALQGCLDGFVGNWPAIELGRDPEAVHRARVSLRRLRAVLPLCRAGVKRSRLRQLAGEARRIASVLGAARNLDILAAYLADCALAGAEPDADLARLSRKAARRRDKAYGQVMDMLAEAATTRFVLSLQILIDDIVAASDQSALAGPAGKLARKSLGRRLGRALKSRRSPARRTPAKRHALRIALKKLRYISDVFGGLYDDEATTDYVDRLSALQRDLGHLNDEAMIRDLLAQWGQGDGLPVRMDRSRRRRLLRRVSADWRAFRTAPAFWRDKSDES